MSRLTISILCVATILFVPQAHARRPNIVLIVGDDHQTEIYGAYGSKLAHTPNLDQLAADGVRFDRAYCNAPICSPSRQSFLTGRYPHAVGVTLLQHPLDKDTYTLAHRLREAGYRTGAFGKMHFNTSALYGFEVHRTPEAFHRERAKLPRRPLPEGAEIQPPWRPFKDPASIWLNSACRPVGLHDDEMPDTWYAQEAITFMKEHRDEPCFVQVGFHQPHSPFQFPVDFTERANAQQMPVPLIGPEDVPQIPKIFAGLTWFEKQGIAAAYHTAAAYLDLNVGRVLAAIEELGLKDDTLVIYLGDNGYHLGHHGRFEKHCCFERAVRVPLVMRLPGRIPPKTSTLALVELVDVVPTVLDYLELPPPSSPPPARDLHGESLRPLIEGRTKKLRDAVFSEYQHTEMVMIRTETHKLIYRTSKAAANWIGYDPILPPEGPGVFLYDVVIDPEEMHNIAGDPANAKLVSDLLDRLGDVYRRTPPIGGPPPEKLSREQFLDWAIAPREPAPTGER